MPIETTWTPTRRVRRNAALLAELLFRLAELVTMLSDALDEAQRLRDEGQRRYPFLDWDA